MTAENRLVSESSASIPPGRRVYAIGDIHGRRDLLELLLNAIREDDARRAPAETEIILIGDLIDRGPESAAVLDFAMNGKLGFAEMRTLLGNHEELLLEISDGIVTGLPLWLRFGGLETLTSFGIDPNIINARKPERLVEALNEAVPLEMLEWLESCPSSIRIGDYLFVHAGVRPGVALAVQNPYDMRWIRGEFLDSDADHGAVIVHGHTISADAEFRENRIGIDTGAYTTGKLTALGLEGSQRWLLQT